MGITTTNQHETFWHLSVLTLILVIGACARFYTLDFLSLSAIELANLSVCDAPNWLGIAINQRVLNGMPFVYPTLLCEATAWLGNGEFAARLPSALAGLGAIFFIYRIGRDFFSPIAGLLAAAILATNKPMVLASREVDLYPLLLLFCLFHLYCFFHMLFSPPSNTATAATIGITGKTYNLAWKWQSAFLGKERFLLGFWLSGALAFYTSYIAVILLAAEILVSLICFRKSLAIALWKPILLLLALWLPVLLGFRTWIMAGNFFALQDSEYLLQIIGRVFSGNLFLIYILLFSTTITVLYCLYKKFSLQTDCSPTYSSTFFIFLLFFSVVLVSYIIPSSSTGRYLFWLAIFFLPSTFPAAILISNIVKPAFQASLTGILVFAITVIQTHTLSATRTFTHEVNADFRLAARIVHDDSLPLNKKDVIIINSVNFNHHLKQHGLEDSFILQENPKYPSEKLSYLPTGHAVYLLEYDGTDKDMLNETALSSVLSGKYTKLCQTTLSWIKITKFYDLHTDHPVNLSDCQTHLVGMVSL